MKYSKKILKGDRLRISGTRLEEVRESYNMSRSEIARIIGANKNHVFKWELGLEFPSLRECIQLSKHMDYPLHQLLALDVPSAENSITPISNLITYDGMVNIKEVLEKEIKNSEQKIIQYYFLTPTEGEQLQFHLERIEHFAVELFRINKILKNINSNGHSKKSQK